MLGALKRWIGGKPAGLDGSPVRDWAKARGHRDKRVRDDQGVVVEGGEGRAQWRIEWGLPQRAYLLDRELRIRMELGLPPGMQLLVTSRRLAEELEQSAYSMFTESMQTQVDSSMPEEMRWLAMFPKTQLAAMKPLRARFAATANNPSTLSGWLDHGLAQRLDEASRTWLVEDQPFVLMTLRGRLYLRLECVQPDEQALDGALAVALCAAQSATQLADASITPQNWPQTSSTAWQNNLE
ncbi:MAG TPA: hypothetical protein VFR90_13710 [Methylibium sp.]|uniref:hypothetical protein n=1 Tax=Methylibium sp. TaxID=2067992 RepID=UPI002DBA7420|nr:hypothetical protein [Methylibium sp.]HEU4460173.1 hypothetical protein [Methylibium sp.]